MKTIRLAVDGDLARHPNARSVVAPIAGKNDRTAPAPSSSRRRGSRVGAFVAATQRVMNAWLGRDLGPLDLAVLMLDGIAIAGHVLVARQSRERSQRDVTGAIGRARDRDRAATIVT